MPTPSPRPRHARGHRFLPVALALLAPLSAGAGPASAPATTATTSTAATAPAFEPTASYQRRDLDGWTVYVSHDLSGDRRDLADRALALLRVKLFEMGRVVPAKALDKLRGTPVWVEFKDRDNPGACYHPSAGWLRANGYNPDKAGGVEISNAQNFLTWSLQQPWMVLHEFAHAYHHRVAGHDNAKIKACYEAAVKSHTYDQVLHINGRTMRAYALNNAQEYFAECSEAYFGVNDFYPFVRAELAKHDPQMYQTLKEVWKGSDD